MQHLRALLHLSLLAALLASSLVASAAQACADRIYPKVLPREEVERYAYAAVISVTEIKFLGRNSGYGAPFNFKAKVLEVLKGDLKKGETIAGATTEMGEASAGCPVSLSKDQTFLVFLNGKDDAYELPRYGSLYLSSTDSRFARYVKQMRNERESAHR